MEHGPLSGRRVVVTRPRERAGPLVEALEAAGAEVILFPAVEIMPPADPAPLVRAAARLDDYHWVAFTSAYAVKALEEALADLDSAPTRPPAGCVGEATGEAAAGAGWTVAVIPAEASGAGLARALLRTGARAGSRVLFPRAADAREDLPRLLREAGVRVDDVVAYRKIGPRGPEKLLRQRIITGTIDLLTFTSPSTVSNFMGFFGEEARAIPAAVMGPTTAAAAEAAGLTVAAVAEESSTKGLVHAVFNALKS